MKGNDTTTGQDMDRTPIARMLQAYGAQLDRWPDQSCAAEARRLLMADRQFRTQWDAERGFDGALAGLRAELDDLIRRDEVPRRVGEAIMARLPRPLDGFRWRSLAAAMVLAAFLGGIVQTLRPPAHAEAAGLVLLDPTLPEFEETLLR